MKLDFSAYLEPLPLGAHTIAAVEMSWQSYVDTQLLATKNVSKAAIHGNDGNPWATSAGFSVSADMALG